MSLDAVIKTKAEEIVDGIVADGTRALASCSTLLTVEDIARLVSGHKTKTTYDKAVKTVSQHIASRMLTSLESDEVDE